MYVIGNTVLLPWRRLGVKICHLYCMSSVIQCAYLCIGWRVWINVNGGQVVGTIFLSAGWCYTGNVHDLFPGAMVHGVQWGGIPRSSTATTRWKEKSNRKSLWMWWVDLKNALLVYLNIWKLQCRLLHCSIWAWESAWRAVYYQISVIKHTKNNYTVQLV